MYVHNCTWMYSIPFEIDNIFSINVPDQSTLRINKPVLLVQRTVEAFPRRKTWVQVGRCSGPSCPSCYRESEVATRDHWFPSQLATRIVGRSHLQKRKRSELYLCVSIHDLCKLYLVNYSDPQYIKMIKWCCMYLK